MCGPRRGVCLRCSSEDVADGFWESVCSKVTMEKIICCSVFISLDGCIIPGLRVVIGGSANRYIGYDVSDVLV